VLREVEAGKSQAQAAREYQLAETSIYKWRRQFARYKVKP
jgi:transposase-like protein